MPGGTILVADDDRDTLEMVDALLTLEGYYVVPCLEVEAVSLLARRVKPALVILDLQMRGPEDGWVLLTLMRADPATAAIPAILYTGNHEFLHQRQFVLRDKRCLTLKKPFSPSALTARVDEALALSAGA